jgi:endonuclease/exonuclease/phosphatase family metal-dependent hydrolase
LSRQGRIAAVLRDVNADVICLQEVVGAGPRGASQVEEIGAALGMGSVMAPARQLRGHQFGNASSVGFQSCITPNTICLGKRARSLPYEMFMRDNGQFR